MKKSELIKLRELFKKELTRRNKINNLLANDLIKEFLTLSNLNIEELPINDKWSILKEILKDFQITESNGIYVCIGSYLTDCRICYEDTDYYTREVSFDDPYAQYQIFKNIETGKMCTAYMDKYIAYKVREENRYNSTTIPYSEFCHKRYGRYLVSELKEKYILLNPYITSDKNNGFEEVQKDFFTTTIDKGQTKAKKLVLSKYPQMR